MLEDDEWADQIVDRIPESSGGPSVEEWSQEAGYLALVVDRLGELLRAVVATGGGKPPKVRPLPRPRTAIDRAMTRRSRRRVESLVAEVEAGRSRR